MFTVKHVKPNGDEFLMECVSFCAERIDGTMDWRFMTFDKEYRESGAQTGLWVGSARGNGISHDTIYVMNRFGATVATHYFEPRDGAVQADPNYVESQFRNNAMMQVQ